MSYSKQLKEKILKGVDALQRRVDDLKELEDLRSRGLKIRYWKIARRGEDLKTVTSENLENIAKVIEAGDPLSQDMADELRRIATDILEYQQFVNAMGETEGFTEGKSSIIRDIRTIISELNFTNLSDDIKSIVDTKTIGLFWRGLGLNFVYFIAGMAATFIITQFFQ